MAVPDKDIRINMLYEDNEYEVSTYSGEYRSLMALIYDNICADDFGQCRGMGRCGTCLIEILGDTDGLGDFDRNEDTTIKKMGVTNPAARLACQIPVTAALQEITIRLIMD